MKPELRFIAMLITDKGAEVVYDDNDLDCDSLHEILEQYENEDAGNTY